MKIVQVMCYSGYQADESPRVLKLGETSIAITEIEDRWYSPGATFFRVVTETGDRYLLRHLAAQNVWTLEGYRSHYVDTIKTRSV